MIEAEERGRVAVLWMEHGAANALDIEFCRQLVDELGRQSAKAVVVAARGPIFCAGVDLLRLLDDGPGYVRRFLPALTDLCETFFSFPRPLVAAVNGHAIAGGCILACTADERIMARGAGRIGVPELLVGVPFPAAPLEILRHAVPHGAFAEIVRSGSTYEPESARQIGLIDALADPAELVDRAVAAAERLASLAPEAFRLTKAQMRRPAIRRWRASAAHDSEVEAVWAAPSTLAAIRDYVSRTFKALDDSAPAGEKPASG